MTRAERRRQQREQNVTKYELTAREIADIKENARMEALAELQATRSKDVRIGTRKAMNHAVIHLLGHIVEILHEELEWDKEDCDWFIDKFREKYNGTDDLLSLIMKIEEYSNMVVEVEEDEL